MHVTLIPLTICQEKSNNNSFFTLFGALNYCNRAEGELKWKGAHADPVHDVLLNLDPWFNICFQTAMTMCYHLDRGP